MKDVKKQTLFQFLIEKGFRYKKELDKYDHVNVSPDKVAFGNKLLKGIKLPRLIVK